MDASSLMNWRRIQARVPDYINLDDMDFDSTFMVKNAVGIVDSTEVLIHAWHEKSFSGKKNNFTLKYQVTIDILTGNTLHIAGPFLGSVHDATIWKESLLAVEVRLACIGDVGGHHFRSTL